MGIFTNHIIFWLLFILFYITFVFVFIIQVPTQFNISLYIIILLKIHYNWSGDLKSRLASFWNEARGVMSGKGCCTAPRNPLSIHPKTMLGSISVLTVKLKYSVKRIAQYILLRLTFCWLSFSYLKPPIPGECLATS